MKSHRLRAFFKYFGAKHRLAPKYPGPGHDLVIEPFAGSAAYATLHALNPERRVLLLDTDPAVAALWRFLIHAQPQDIDNIPLIPVGDTVVNVLGSHYGGVIPSGVKELVGFWMRTGSPTPRNHLSPWAKVPEYADRFWGVDVKNRLKEQIPYIRDWRVEERSYEYAPNEEATWFIDPPYQKTGGAYSSGKQYIDYDHLRDWCHDRRGTVIVCEQEGAKWMKFYPFKDLHTNVNAKGQSPRYSREVVAILRDGRDVTRDFLSLTMTASAAYTGHG